MAASRLPVTSRRELFRWRPIENGIEIVVAQADLTTATTDAIVNAANEELQHIGGLALAIAWRAGDVVQQQSRAYIEANGKLCVGHAMSTSAGALPCRVVIHTVGPRVPFRERPTAVHATALRAAVTSALLEGERLGLQSIAMPGISTGIFGYPRALGAQEIVAACEAFCRDRGAQQHSIERIELMNHDAPTDGDGVVCA